MPKKIDLTGQRFGRLVVLEEAGRKNGSVTWLCQCDCKEKNIVFTRGSDLRKGSTKSCGCFNKEKTKETNTKHGQSNKNNKPTSVYKSWQDMLSRCYNPNNSAYHNYGGRGIKVCERWHDFENFYEDIGKYKPKGKTLERINNDDGYYLENCRWATRQEQTWNTRAKGYYQDKRGKYYTQIKVDYKDIYLGSFDTPEEARQAYIKAKWKYHGVWLDE